ncbi:MAG: Ig-like domain-containing protein, partial [Bacteroidota bacterium]|nr:Ig-like domain-containing protein [Bacteroidota bacterium]
MKKSAIPILLLVLIAATTGCSNKMKDNPDSLFNFLTLELGPHVTSITPSNGTNEVPVATNIQVFFSTEMNVATISGDTCFVVDNNYQPVSGAWGLDPEDLSIAIFTPNSNLNNLTKYTVLISTDVRDASGFSLTKEAQCSFTTEYDGTVPAPTFTPAAGTFYSGELAVTIQCQDPMATIRYFTYGPGPSLSIEPSPTQGTIYTGPIRISETTTIMAIAYRDVSTYSVVSSITYTYKAATPIAYPPAGTYNAALNITLSTATPGATISYAATLVSATDMSEGDFDVIGEGDENVSVALPARAGITTYLVTATASKAVSYTHLRAHETA